METLLQEGKTRLNEEVLNIFLWGVQEKEKKQQSADESVNIFSSIFINLFLTKTRFVSHYQHAP